MENRLDSCEICLKNQAKYTCPRCKLHTCSLECFKNHKEAKNCSGKSDSSMGTRDTYINQKEISGNDVQRDYNFLLNVNRSLELTKRKKEEIKVMKFQRRNNNSNNNRQVISQRGVRVRKVPHGMERGRTNKTGNGKGNTFFWTIEWLWIDKDGKILSKYLRYRSLESATLNTLIPKDWETGNDYRILFKDSEKNAFLHLPSNARLSDALFGKLVIEFPTLYLTTVPPEEFTHKVLPFDEKKESASSSSGSSSEESSDDSSSTDTSSSSSDDDAPPEESSARLSHVE